METAQLKNTREEEAKANPYGTFPSPNEDTGSTKWIMVSILSLLSCLNQAICYTYAPISKMAEANWNKEISCTTLITIYFISYIPFAFFGSWVMDKKGLRFGIILGATLQASGAVLRTIADFDLLGPSNKLWLLVLGQTMAAIAMPFMVNSPPMLSALWFPSTQRAMATSIAVNCNQLGIALVYILCPIFVTSPVDVPYWSAFIASLSLGALALAWCFFKAASKFIHDDISYDWHQWVSAFHHEGFALTVFVFSVAETVTNVLSSLLNHILRADVYTKTEKGLIGAAFIVSALVGGQVVSSYIDGTRLHKLSLILCLTITGISLVCFQLTASAVFSGQMYATMGLLMLGGLFLGPLQPISLELGVECAHPTSEATVAALQQLCGNFLSALLVPLLGSIQHTADSLHEQQLTDPQHAPESTTSAIVIASLTTPGSVLSILIFIAAFMFCGFGGQFKRSAHEEKKSIS